MTTYPSKFQYLLKQLVMEALVVIRERKPTLEMV
jgi:hypothetical protein